MADGEVVVEVDGKGRESIDDANASWWDPIDDDRTWWALLLLGIVLSAWVCATSDLGLDTHIHLTLASEEARTGEARLDWGHTRTSDPAASDPSIAPLRSIGWFSFLPASSGETAVRAFGLLCVYGLIVAAWAFGGGRSDSISGSEGRWQRSPRLAALVSIHPTLLFATGRVFPEAAVALAAVMVAVALWIAADEQEWPAILAALAAGVSPGMAIILAIKGFNPTLGLSFAGVAALWILADRQWSTARELTRRPARAAAISAGAVSGSMVAIGMAGGGGTLGIIAEAPGRYSLALLVSILDVIGIYALFGMVIWPFARQSWVRIGEVRDGVAALLAAFIAAMGAAITVYVAALWTLEAALWDAPWPWVMWTMGNNARYISLIMVPCFLLLARLASSVHCEVVVVGENSEETLKSESNDPRGGGLSTLEDPRGKSMSLAMGVMLLLPISLLTALHGQTMWTDDAATVLSDEMENGDDFLFVADATLGMHWLYTFRTEIDPDASRDITGHWRTPDSGWQDELLNGDFIPDRGPLEDVRWIVLSPGVDRVVPFGWTEVATGEADWMNGGGQWTVLHSNPAA